MVKQVTKYLADDGKEFDTREGAEDHDKKRTKAAEDNFARYLKTYYGQRLLEKYTLKTDGLWEVRGEDPNCDMGGAHYQPYIGTVEGPLETVIKWAVVQPQFWQWGSGGEIKRILITKM